MWLDTKISDSETCLGTCLLSEKKRNQNCFETTQYAQGKNNSNSKLWQKVFNLTKKHHSK